MNWYGGIEAGGTKFNCIVAGSPRNILAELKIPTSSPQETLPLVAEFFKTIQSQNSIKLTSLGLGSFGPLCLDQSSPNYGVITSTPKLAWRNTNILAYFINELQAPVAFDTDVTAAALGEGKWGAALGCKDFIYMTIGTGIGGGVIVNGSPVHGLVHPEIGHMFIPHDFTKDPFEGVCPSHGDCLEGLASGPAIQARCGERAESLPFNHEMWQLEARYLGFMLANIVLTYSPQRIILGGGVMKTRGLIQSVRKEFLSIIGNYVQENKILSEIDRYVQLPGLGDKAGVLGSIALAQTL